MMNRRRIVLLALSLVAAAPAPNARAQNLDHDRHTHHHNPKHATEGPTPARFITSRKSDIVLPLPQEKDAFTFVVFGDRTGGPAVGVRVLADAVRDTNLIEPDLVMTVGDLVEGYNANEAWREQVNEYKAIMGELRCPWFPVPGNHDTYWRGEGRPPLEHEENYEKHMGPLWYAFEHKNSWFISLYSDETNPATGLKDFENPDNHRMSEEQFTWLGETLAKARGADHVFLFLHHPRWTGGNYGTHWDRVHRLLVSAGNVTAVFAGHIHRMRYDPRDGIEYVTLATVGGAQDGLVPNAGWLHQFHLITVRKGQVAMAAIPVGEVMDVREITGELSQQCREQAAARPELTGELVFAADGGVTQVVSAKVRNVTTRAIDVTVAPDSADSRWRFGPDHYHARIEAGGEREFEFAIRRPAGHADDSLRGVEFVLNTDVLLPGHRYALPEQRTPFTLNADSLPAPAPPAHEIAMRFDGDDALLIDDATFTLPDGPFTLEAWMKADAFTGRNGLICKTEQSEYGLFVGNGTPEFSVHLNGAYVTVMPDSPRLEVGRWHHVAAVFDGAELRVYVDGTLTAKKTGSGVRKTNRLPLVVGADVGARGEPNSHFTGLIDAVRVSKRAVYSGVVFTPQRRLAPDADTVLLTNMDAMLGTSVWGEGPRRIFGRAVGAAVVAGD